MDTKEALAHAEASYTELCAAMRASDEPWEVTERRPQLKRMRAVVDHFAALAGEAETAERRRAEYASALLAMTERAVAAEARAEGLAARIENLRDGLSNASCCAYASAARECAEEALAADDAALNPPRGGGEEA